MKAKFYLVLSLLLIAAFVAVPFSAARAQTPEPDPEEEVLNEAEFNQRMESATNVSLAPSMNQSGCILAIPSFEASPTIMGAYDDWTRVSVCIKPEGVESVGWSAFRYPPLHFKAHWRLVDVKTRQVIAQTIEDKALNPVSNVPHAFLRWLQHCGPERELLLLLDISARQIVNGKEVGLANRDHSWHFTLRAQICKRYMAFIVTPPSPPPPGCPHDFKARVEAQNATVEALLSKDGTAITQVLTVYPPGKLVIKYLLNGVLTALPNGGTILKWPDGSIAKDYGRGPIIEILAGIWPFYDLTIMTLYGDFIAPNGDRCWYSVKVQDPPALLAQQLINNNPTLQWDEAYAITLETFEEQLALGLTSEEAYKATLQKLSK